MVRGFGDRQIQSIEPVAVQGGERVLLCDSFVRASRYAIQPGKQTVLERDDDRAVLLRISSGQGSVMMADSSEVGGALHSIAFNQGDLILIPPRIHYSVRNETQDYVRYSEHRIAPEVAFI
jgi:mannose-6-phosphate isomerase-like protein (cupin superfamily)